MRRRRFLAGAGLAVSGVAGCSTFRPGTGFDPPSVLDDRPEGVYVPTHTVGSRLVGVRDVGDYRVALAYSYPVRFWTVTGTRVHRVEVAEDDTVHLLANVWEPDAGVVLPDAGVTVAVLRDGGAIYEEVVYPMLAGRVGVHHGDNVSLPADGEYAVQVTVGGPGARARGDYAGRFGDLASAGFTVDYSRREREDLPAERTGDRAGRPGAPEPRAPGGSGEDAGTVPAGTVPAPADLPGRVVATVERGDAVFVVAVAEGGGEDGGDYLAVSPRSRYNRFPLPAMGLTATLRRGGESVFAGPLRAAVDPGFGYHYGAAVEEVADGDALSMSIPTTPQVARHEGYETAFTDLSGFEVRV